MRDIAIRVSGLGKRYRIGASKPRHDTLRDSVVHSLGSLFRKNEAAAVEQEFWALKNVSFEVHRGDVLGLIGRNGAGKSTLLKILSRITVPTEGRAEMSGRLGSLLEVGTGFNTELTGRENIYLSGAIMGMRRAEIARKFDEIVDFSGIQKFLDTPVKRYSSGMYVRLAFAVAAHLEPEILIVDEVLAVGDASFQKKCLGKMGNVAKEGRTVLFVSHNMAAVQNLCTRGMVLSDGQVTFRGSAIDASEHYLSGGSARGFGIADLSHHPGRLNDYRPVVQSIGLLANHGRARYTETARPGEDLVFEIQYDTGELSLDNAVVAIHSSAGERLLTVGSRFCSHFNYELRGKGILTCRLPQIALKAGEYRVMVAMGRQISSKDVDCVEDALTFRVEPTDFFGTGKALLPGQGHFAVRSEWRMMPVAEEVGSLP